MEELKNANSTIIKLRKMENGGLNDTFRGLTVNDAKDDDLSKVLKAVQAAEATIRQQAEDNNRLRAELQQRDQELEYLQVDKSVAQRYYSFDTSDEHRQRVNKARQGATFDPLSTLVLHQDPMPKSDAIEYNHFSVSRSNGNLSTLSGGQTPDNARSSQLSSPSATFFSPGRFPNDREYDPHTNGPAQGWMQVSESEDQSRLQQQIKEHEEEIMQLRRHLTHYSVKEAQIRNEKCVLENRIAHMRMAFDQQQQDLVNAASKALSYRQDIIEENVRLACALQDAQQERTTFVSSLLPLLAEYSLQPQVSDAQSIVSNVKLLFRHLQENLLITEARLKESQYQLTPWRSDWRDTKFASQSQGNSSGAALTSSAIGLELVPRPTYSPVNLANSDATDWELRRQNAFQGRAGGSQNSKVDNMGMYSSFASRDSSIHDVSAEVAVNRDDLRATYNRQVQFKDPASSSDVDGAAADLHHNESEYPGAWGSDTSPHSNTYEDSNPAYSPYLQPVLEKPSSSFSEAAEDDVLPAIEGLQISGEAYPGRELQACGYSVNGTTSCNFEWVRHLEDGSVNYIDGAKQPVYLVTADDVEAYLAIEVQPLDDRKRKGDIVKVFANDHRKITCDPAMSSHIEQNLRNGHASYTVFLSTGYLDIWQPATLNIKREGYSIKDSGSNAVTANEKFLPGTLVTITYGQDIEFSIFNPNGDAHLLRAQNYIPDIMSLRDTIVLLLRSFIMKAAENGKVRRRRVRFFSR